MRIVVYNFVQPGDAKSKQGGGVAVYQDNLLKELAKGRHDVIVLSSGDRYDVSGSAARVEFLDGGERAVIFNSPVLAPAHFTFHRIERYFEEPGLDHIPGVLRTRYGTIEVFHFQNIEGLTAGFFRALRKEFPAAQILLSAHNYNFVCPQVNLWYREQQHCQDYREGRACVNCVMLADVEAGIRNARRMETVLRALRLAPDSDVAKLVESLLRRSLRLARRIVGLGRRAGKPPPSSEPGSIVVTSEKKALDYRRFRETNIRLADEIFDAILAVSSRTREVLIERGVPAEKIGVSYIGTAHYSKFLASTKISDAGGRIHLSYLGYMRADKGFYFFLDALAYLDEATAKKVSVTIAAPIRDLDAIDRLRAMAYKFSSLRVFDGFSHKTLDSVLDGVNLGVVPVLWEDNLPQVAIEMVSRGIPILTSDKGGAKEIGSNPEFTFLAGSKLDFCDRLRRLVIGNVPLAAFWTSPTRILSMEQHVADLLRYYEGHGPSTPDTEISLAATMLQGDAVLTASGRE